MILIILSCISLTDPTKETYFEYYICSEDKKKLESKIAKIKKAVLRQNKKEYILDSIDDEECPYYDGYKSPEYTECMEIKGNFLPLDDNEVFLIESHTSYLFAYSITVRNLKKSNTFQLYEH